MTSISSQKKMKFTSDYPIEKVMYIASGSDTVVNGTSDATPGITVAHGLPFTPLPILQWSNTSDFAITNTFGDSSYNSTYFTGSSGQQYSVYATSTNIEIYRYNNSGSNKSLFWRVVLLAPSDADIDSEVEFTANTGDKFIFNSDYNYMKLFHAGFLTTGDTTYSHSLGYVPRVMAWENSGSAYSPLILPQLIDTDPTGSGGQTGGVYVDTSKIEWLNPTSYNKIEYRIYLDE